MSHAGAPLSSSYGALTFTPGTFGEARVLREIRPAGGGIRPPIPGLLPQQPECRFGARCPGRPGRCAAHVKHTRVQAGEVCTCVGLEPRVWASAAPVGSPTHLSPAHPCGHGAVPVLRARSGHKQGSACGVCAVCVRGGPHLMSGKGVFMGMCAPGSLTTPHGGTRQGCAWDPCLSLCAGVCLCAHTRVCLSALLGCRTRACRCQGAPGCCTGAMRMCFQAP